MSEIGETLGVEEVGRSQFDRLSTVLGERESQGYNIVGWGGNNSELRTQVESNALYPTSAFAVVAEGVSRYKRVGDRILDDSDSMRDLASALSGGAEVFPQANAINEAQLKAQIRQYLESHGGVFDESTDWQSFIQTQAGKIKSRAAAVDEMNR